MGDPLGPKLGCPQGTHLMNTEPPLDSPSVHGALSGVFALGQKMDF